MDDEKIGIEDNPEITSEMVETFEENNPADFNDSPPESDETNEG